MRTFYSVQCCANVDNWFVCATDRNAVVPFWHECRSEVGDSFSFVDNARSHQRCARHDNDVNSTFVVGHHSIAGAGDDDTDANEIIDSDIRRDEERSNAAVGHDDIRVE